MLDLGAAIKGAVKDLLDNIGLLLGATFIMTVVMGVLVGLTLNAAYAVALTDAGEAINLPALVGIVAVLFCTSTYFTTGFIAICLKIQRHERPNIGTLFAQGGRIMPSLIAGLLIGLVVSVGVVPAVFAAPFAGPVLTGVFITGWAIFVWAATCLTLYFVIDRQQPALTALGSSYRATKGNLGWLFLMWVVTTVIGSFLSAVPVLGTLVAMSFTGLLMARVYMQLKTKAI